MKQFKILLLTSIVILLTACGGGGESAPTDDDNISVVKLTDLRLGYLAKGLIRVDIGEDFHYDLGFCNEELTVAIYGDYIDDYYWVDTYEIVGEEIILYSNGEVMIDTSDSGILEEGKNYLIEQPKDNLSWYIGSISTIECIVEDI